MACSHVHQAESGNLKDSGIKQISVSPILQTSLSTSKEENSKEDGTNLVTQVRGASLPCAVVVSTVLVNFHVQVSGLATRCLIISSAQQWASLV